MLTPAVVYTAVDTVAVRDLDLPPPGAGEVQVRTQYSTISSGTEGWALQARFTWSPTPFPCVPGYQRVGIITALGAGVSGWQVGEQVFATVGRWTGPVAPFWGAHVGLANTPAHELYKLPAGIDPVDASAAVVAQVGYNAAYRPTLAAGDWVVVLGDGIIGQCAAQAARSRGARVVLVGHRAERLALGRAHSADAVVDSHAGNLVAQVRALIGQDHVPVLLDSLQTVDTQREYLDLLAHGRGQIVYCGFTPTPTWADMGWLQQRELTTHHISGWNRPRLEATLALLAARRMQVRPLVTHLVSYRQAPALYALIRGKSAPFMGLTLDWTREE